MRFIVATLLLASLVGCVDSEDTYRISGSFTADRADEDIQALVDKGRGLGGDTAIMESFPEQFTVRAFGLKECRELETWLAAQDFIASMTSCERDGQPS